MKKFIAAFVIFFIVSCSEADFYGDVDLGSDFYYMVEPSFNSIRHLNGSANSYVLRKIEYIGSDDNYILAINKMADKNCYWIIDKTKKTEDTGYNKIEERVLFSNVTGPVDSTHFMAFKNKLNIQLNSKQYYKKKGGWK